MSSEEDYGSAGSEEEVVPIKIKKGRKKTAPGMLPGEDEDDNVENDDDVSEEINIDVSIDEEEDEEEDGEDEEGFDTLTTGVAGMQPFQQNQFQTGFIPMIKGVKPGVLPPPAFGTFPQIQPAFGGFAAAQPMAPRPIEFVLQTETTPIATGQAAPPPMMGNVAPGTVPQFLTPAVTGTGRAGFVIPGAGQGFAAPSPTRYVGMQQAPAPSPFVTGPTGTMFAPAATQPRPAPVPISQGQFIPGASPGRLQPGQQLQTSPARTLQPTFQAQSQPQQQHPMQFQTQQLQQQQFQTQPQQPQQQYTQQPFQTQPQQPFQTQPQQPFQTQQPQQPQLSAEQVMKTISTAYHSQPLQQGVTVDQLVQTLPNETPVNYDRRLQLSRALASIPNFPIDPMTAVILGQILMNKSQFGSTFAPDVEAAIARVSSLIR
jgi:hypothetical protein